MIECVVTADFFYWITLMAEITTQIDPTTYVVHSDAGDVTWRLVYGDWCRT